MDKQKFWSLNGLIQDTFLNVISARIYTNDKDKYHGITGLGEMVTDDLFLDDGVYSLWTRDDASPVATGNLPGANAYGVHPFYMAQAQDLSWFGIYTNLAAAQDWWIANNPDNGTVDVQMIAIGGIADITFMFGPSPNEVTQRYHDVVGKPVLTPMWALGWS